MTDNNLTPETGYYLEKLPSYGDLMTVEEFKACVKEGGFIDYDGWGHAVKDNMMDPGDPDYPIRPSKLFRIPKDATHIIWFNR